MRQVRVSTTSDSTGKIMYAILQEAEYQDGDTGRVHWRDVKPLEIVTEGGKTTVVLDRISEEEWEERTSPEQKLGVVTVEGSIE